MAWLGLVLLCLVSASSGMASNCSIDPIAYIASDGSPGGGSCSSCSEGIVATSFLCSSSPDCKYFLCPDCTIADGACNCVYCDGPVNLVTDRQVGGFYIKTRPLQRGGDGGDNEALIPGTASIADQLVLISLFTEDGDVVFYVEINFIARRVVSNSIQNGERGENVVNLEGDDFDLEQKDAVSLLYVVKESEFELFLDKKLYSSFPLRFSYLSSVSAIQVSTPNEKGKLYACYIV
ncbi:hypothetical protein ElyMa_006805600 [Elysia marginata]|uniref:Galectin n=1 Tax=Elysia marginata TaxID=1093978 RepID=A0AAV4J754_9GAST|nr:hypothetical protein ElyMa_006805600 [Elysia marginata]